jgi:hypothetical protein
VKNATNFQQENLMLVHVTENNSCTRKNINFATSNRDDAIADALFVNMLNCGRFENVLQQWHQSQGLVVQLIGDATINSTAVDSPAAAGIVRIASAAPALVVLKLLMLPNHSTVKIAMTRMSLLLLLG